MDDQKEQVVEEEVEVEKTAPKSRRKFKMGPKRTLRVAGIVIVLLIIVYLIKGGVSEAEFVATVNGEKILKADFDTRIELVLASSQVENVDTIDPAFRAQLEEQVLNELINTKLLLQGAMDAGITTEQSEVDVQYGIIVDQFGSESVLEDTLAQSGVTVSVLRQNIEDQIIISAFINAQIGEDGVSATEEEIVALYDRDAVFQDNMPLLEEIHSQLEAQVIADKTQQIALELIGQLRAEANIEIVSADIEENDEEEDDEEDTEEETESE